MQFVKCHIQLHAVYVGAMRLCIVLLLLISVSNLQLFSCDVLLTTLLLACQTM